MNEGEHEEEVEQIDCTHNVRRVEAVVVAVVDNVLPVLRRLLLVYYYDKDFAGILVQ